MLNWENWIWIIEFNDYSNTSPFLGHEAASIIVNSRFNPPQKTNPAHGAAALLPPARARTSRLQVHEPKAARSVPSQHNSISFNCVLKQIQPFHNFADVVHRRIRLRLAEEDDRMQDRGTNGRCRPPRLSATNSHQPAPAGHQNRPLRPKGLPQPRKRARAFTRADGLPHVGESGCTCKHGLAVWGPKERKGGEQPDGVGLAAV